MGAGSNKAAPGFEDTELESAGERLLVSDASEEDTSEGDMDHGLGAVDALLVVAHEPAPPLSQGQRLRALSRIILRAGAVRDVGRW